MAFKMKGASLYKKTDGGGRSKKSLKSELDFVQNRLNLAAKDGDMKEIKRLEVVRNEAKKNLENKFGTSSTTIEITK